MSNKLAPPLLQLLRRASTGATSQEVLAGVTSTMRGEKSVNMVELIGRVGQEPVQHSDSFLTFNLATNRR